MLAAECGDRAAGHRTDKIQPVAAAPSFRRILLLTTAGNYRPDRWKRPNPPTACASTRSVACLGRVAAMDVLALSGVRRHAEALAETRASFHAASAAELARSIRVHPGCLRKRNRNSRSSSERDILCCSQLWGWVQSDGIAPGRFRSPIAGDTRRCPPAIRKRLNSRLDPTIRLFATAAAGLAAVRRVGCSGRCEHGMVELPPLATRVGVEGSTGGTVDARSRLVSMAVGYPAPEIWGGGS